MSLYNPFNLPFNGDFVERLVKVKYRLSARASCQDVIERVGLVVDSISLRTINDGTVAGFSGRELDLHPFSLDENIQYVPIFISNTDE